MASSTARKLSANEVADLLDEMALRLELAHVSKFKVRAYENAAASLRTLFEPLEDLVAAGELTSIPGVGNAIAEKIERLHRTGTHPSLEQLREQGPAGILEMVRIPGVGPKRALALYEKLQISNLNELRAACEENRLADVKGFGRHMQTKVLANLDATKNDSAMIRLNRATARAVATAEAIKKRYPKLTEVIPAGDLRRGCELCRGLVFALTGPEKIVAQIQAQPNPLIQSGRIPHFGATLLFATGSEAHLNELMALARGKGLTLTAEGLRRGKKLLPSETEVEIYAALGLQFIEPELREGLDEIELAKHGKLPQLVRESDLRGVLHCHTDFSDGVDTLEDMAAAAAERGLQYFGVCDHSKSAFYAGGLKFDKVLEQHALADDLNAKRSKDHAYVFKGIESDILKDGSLDYSPDELATFDFVVASVHGRFALSHDEQTARILQAVRNPYTTILGHPTGRLLLSRKGYDVDLEEILKTCAEHGVAVEINGDPHRMDLDWRWHCRALEWGCMLSINPDAHDTLALSYLKWGTLMARKGGVPASRVLNCMMLDEIRAHFLKRRQAAAKYL
jgi:DNA polymerase (family 10)